MHHDPPNPDPAKSGDEEVKGRVLVVDDEPSVRLSFRLALETVGWDVDDAEDSDQALTALEEARGSEGGAEGDTGYHAMVLDFRMPGRNGVDTIAEMTRRNIFVPTLLASAHLDDATVVEAARLGVADFLCKPVSLPGLRDGVERLVEDERRFVEITNAPKADSERLESTQRDSAREGLIRLRGLIRRRRVAEARQAITNFRDQKQDSSEQKTAEWTAWESLVEMLEQEKCANTARTGDTPLFGLIAKGA